LSRLGRAADIASRRPPEPGLSLRRPGEVAPAYVLLASNEGSYISGAMIPVTGGRPML